METAEILTVDDEEPIRIGLKRLLEGQGYRVELAATAEEALRILAARDFDLVLTDIQMPGMDGLELLRQIKSRSPQTPVVILTAHALAENVIHALRAGANDFIPKPYKPDELLMIVGREAERGYKTRRQTPALSQAPAVVGLQLTPAQLGEIDAILSELRAEASARCVLMVESTGHVIDAKGAIEELNISALAALVAGDFAAASGIASLLGEQEPFHLNYHEGSRFSVYSAHLTPDLFLLVVFGQEAKSGMVLYATRQVLPQLKSIVERVPAQASAAPADHAEPLKEQLFSLDQILESDLLGDSALDALEEQFKKMWQQPDSKIN